MRIGITGASGFIGQTLAAKALETGHEVIGYSRRQVGSTPLGMLMCVSSSENPVPETRLDALVHLAGESLMGLWTEQKRKRIWSSRVELTQRLVSQLQTWETANRPRVLLCASGIGFYGSRGAEVLEENSSRGTGFLANLCFEWEAAAKEAARIGIRVVHLRTGMVLGKNGGALPLMRRAFSFGLGGRLGSGTQWLSWIHEKDQAALILWALETGNIAGPVNLCTPNPVPQAEFSRLLARQLKRPAFMHMPALVLRLLLRGMADEMLLCSQRAFPRVATDLGGAFAYPNLEGALSDLAS